MDIPKASKSVRRITVLQKDSSGNTTPVTLFKRKKKKKKEGTPAFRAFERTTRRLAEGQRRAAESYLARHKDSNDEREDGWIRDFPINALRAAESGRKALKLDDTVDEILDDIDDELDDAEDRLDDDD